MTRVERIGQATLICGDCRDVLPTLDRGSIDLCLTDPPYGVTSLPWDKPVRGWAALVLPLLALPGSLWCFGSLRFFLAEHAEFDGWTLAQDVIWAKHNGSNFHADRFRRVHEIVAHFYPASVPWAEISKDPQFTHDATARTVMRKKRPTHTGHIEASHYTSEDGGPRLVRSVIEVRSCHGHAEHPTQKPRAILAPLIAYSCPPGGMVLDQFMGSGSTGLEALASGRRFIGIEANAAHFETALRRFGQNLFAGAA